ncbi:nucleoporin Nup120/160-domain-containing protein [Amylocarpus encephaloides]|uniref:Nucleoporin Nup120/160-domain-containing protein n=1 Tax=Amylocarpus encephaloides TaxID=45428 RepID=A0A9P7YEA2_9HELO|nr:nucleoporin Nup120/160-domain-containing protein [Amylocarpus encephaloides]
MERRTPLCAYKEVRLNLEPSSQGSTVAIKIPAHGTIWPGRTAQKRFQIIEFPVAENEEAFRHRYLATSASVYHRVHHSSPRSFLWRVLENGKALSIQAVDVSKPVKNALDAPLTLRFYFPSKIVPSCIAFSDSERHHALSVFVLTESNHLYTLNLRPEFFRKASSAEEDNLNWCKSYLPSAFSFKYPHRLVALHAGELLISLIDGGLLRLTLQEGGGSDWKEVFYNEGGWSHSLRSLIPFHGSKTVTYEKQNLDVSTVTSIASSIVEVGTMPYAFTVSLDHQLRIWNLATGKLAYMGDIVNQYLDPKDAGKDTISPSLSQLIKVFCHEGTALCITYSPLRSGEFKFWDVTPTEDGIRIDDKFPRCKLVPRAPTADLWTMADFSVILDSLNPNVFSIWTLWKNNTTYRVQALDLEGSSDDSVTKSWGNDWRAVATETIREMPTPTLFSGDSLDITDKWLEFLLAPGKFTTATIETGLAICESNSGISKSRPKRSESLPERMCSVIASSNTLGRTSEGKMDYEQLRVAIESQWLRFYRLLGELDKQRGEAQSLVIDPHGNMPWVVLADGVTAVRDCSPLEKLWHSPKELSNGAHLVMAPILAASELRESFSEQLSHTIKTQLLGELFEDSSSSGPASLRALYERCDFEHKIGDEDYTQLEDRLKEFGRGFKDITPGVYEAMLELMSPSDNLAGPSLHPLASFGNKMIVRGAQEIVELHRNICLDQIVLLILIEAEVNHTEEGIQFEITAVYNEFMSILKRLELISWLASNQISLPLEKRERSNSITEKAPKKQGPTAETVTVLQGVLRHLFGLSNNKMSSAVTDVILSICVPNSEYEAPPAVIQCFLLDHERPDLAMDFNRFADRDPFSIYIQGRACLASDDAQAAAMLFKKAAFGISFSDSKARGELRSAGYLDETERNLLNAGFPRYYSHIVALFEKEKLYSFVIDFAQLALQFLNPGTTDEGDGILRTEMHSRLFNAAIQSSRYDIAYSALVRLTNHTLQLTSLRTLITKMCENSYASELVELPLIGVHDEVDDILTRRCQDIVDVTVGVPYHKILYAWRIKRNDFRGAAAISLERLQKLQNAGEGDRTLEADELETPVTKQYMTLINALSCVDKKQAWILYEEPPQKGSKSSRNGIQPKRKVITLDDIRKDYQAELDRIAAIENDQFAFVDGDEMDVL